MCCCLMPRCLAVHPPPALWVKGPHCSEQSSEQALGEVCWMDMGPWPAVAPLQWPCQAVGLEAHTGLNSVPAVVQQCPVKWSLQLLTDGDTFTACPFTAVPTPGLRPDNLLSIHTLNHQRGCCVDGPRALRGQSGQRSRWGPARAGRHSWRTLTRAHLALGVWGDGAVPSQAGGNERPQSHPRVGQDETLPHPPTPHHPSLPLSHAQPGAGMLEGLPATFLKGQTLGHR